MDTASKTPLLDQVNTPQDLRRLPEKSLHQLADELRRETIDAVAVTGGHLGAGPGRRRADRGAAPRVRYAARPADLGRRPPGLPAQDPDRPARPHPHPAPGRRAVRLHQARGERIRRLRRGAFLDLDLGGSRHGGRPRPRRRHAQRRVRDRRRRHERRHGLRGHEQCRRAQRAADRHPQRQRHVDRPAGRRAIDVSGQDLLERHLPALARHRQAACQAAAEILGAPRRARRGDDAHLLDGRHAVRGARLLLRRADRRPRSQRAAARPGQRARRAAGPDPGARGDEEGERLPAGRGLRRQVSRRQPLQCDHRRAGQTQAERAELHAHLRRKPGRRGEEGRQDRCHHGGDAVRDGPRPFRAASFPSAPSMSASPSSTA